MLMNRIPSILCLLATVFIPTGLSQAAESGEAILERAINAAGNRFGSVKGPMLWMTKGTAYQDGLSQPFIAQYATRWPDRFRREIEGVFTTTSNGEQVWITGRNGIRPLARNELKNARQQIRLRWLNYLFPLQDNPQYQLKAIPGIQVEKRPTVGLLATHQEGDEIKLYFDRETFLLTKMESMLQSTTEPQATVREEVFLSDHQSMGGVQVASREKRFHDGSLIMEAVRVATKTGATLDPEFFKTPQ